MSSIVKLSDDKNANLKKAVFDELKTKNPELTEEKFNQALKSVEASYGGANFKFDKSEEVFAATKYMIDLQAKGLKLPQNIPASALASFKDFEKYVDDLYIKGKKENPKFSAVAPTGSNQDTDQTLRMTQEEWERKQREKDKDKTPGSNAFGANMDPETRKMLVGFIKAFFKMLKGDFSGFEELGESLTGDFNGKSPDKTDKVSQGLQKFIGALELKGDDLKPENVGGAILKNLSKLIDKKIVVLGENVTIEKLNEAIDAAVKQKPELLKDGAKLAQMIEQKASDLAKEYSPNQAPIANFNGTSVAYDKMKPIALSEEIAGKLKDSVKLKGMELLNDDGVNLSAGSELTAKNIDEKLKSLGAGAKIFIPTDAAGKPLNNLIRLESADGKTGFNISVPTAEENEAVAKALSDILKTAEKLDPVVAKTYEKGLDRTAEAKVVFA